MRVVDYVEFDDSAYSNLRRSLIGKSTRSRDAQRGFLEKVLVTTDFVDYMNTAVPLTGSQKLDPLAEQMSEAEFKDPPGDTEQSFFQSWAELTPRIACRTTFWALVTCRHIENGRIESSFLAGNGGAQSCGAERIEAALRSSDSNAPGLLDNCVRTVLRRLGGLPEARGNRTVYVNCPLARGWWRERLVAEVADGQSELEAVVREVVRVSQQYWEELVTFVVSRNSVFGSPEVRNVFIRTLGAKLSADSNSAMRNASELRRAARTLSTIQASRELSLVGLQELEEIVKEVVEMHAAEARRRKIRKDGAL